MCIHKQPGMPGYKKHNRLRVSSILHPTIRQIFNLVPRAHVPFGQHQDTELWNNQFPETKILGLPASRRMRGLVYMVSRDKVDVDKFHKGIQYALERLGKSKFGFESIKFLKQKPRRLWERAC